MAGEALRSLYAEVGWKIDEAPLQRLDKLLDQIKKSMLGGSVERFEEALSDAGDEAKDLGEELKKTGQIAATALDDAADEAHRLKRETKNAGDEADRSRRKFQRFGDALNRISRNMTSGFWRMSTSILRAPFTLPGLLTGGLAAYGIGSVVKTSIGGAARLEMQALQLEALLKDADKARQLFEDMNRLGRVSVFSEEEFLEGAKTFLPLTRDLDQINRLVRLQERLAASNPIEGMAGAAFSIREALSGDTVSLVERFNIPRSMVENLRKATSLTDRIEELDKILTELGFTQEYLTKVNESASAQWDNFKSNLSMGFARAGERALEELKPFLKDLNEFLGSPRAERMFDRWGQGLAKMAREAANFGRWLMERGGAAFDYIDRKYLSNPEFQQLPFNRKIEVVFADIERKFTAWYNGGGRKKMEEGAEALVSFMAGALKASQPLLDAAAKVGAAVGQGMLTGLKDFAQQNPELSALLAFISTPGPIPVKLASAATIGTSSALSGAIERENERRKEQEEKRLGGMVDFYQRLESKPKDQPLPGWENTYLAPVPKKSFGQKVQDWFKNLLPGHADGLPYVPKDDYIARLHEGERVLTKHENRAYTQDRMQAVAPINATINVNVSAAAAAGGASSVKEAARQGAREGLEEFWRSLRRNYPAITEV